jgi:hypothetical protein
MLQNTKSWQMIRKIRPPRSTVLKNISRSWTALGHQLESLALIEKSDGKK